MLSSNMNRKKILGQGMTEYIIIVALIAIAAIAAFTFFGKTIRQDVAGMSAEMAGQDSSQATEGAKQAAQQAQQEADKDKGLSDYGDGSITQ